jgi:hypothetical protein
MKVMFLMGAAVVALSGCRSADKKTGDAADSLNAATKTAVDTAVSKRMVEDTAIVRTDTTVRTDTSVAKDTMRRRGSRPAGGDTARRTP